MCEVILVSKFSGVHNASRGLWYRYRIKQYPTKRMHSFVSFFLVRTVLALHFTSDHARIDFRPAAAARPPFEDKKEATKCPVCESTFGKLLHQKKHCRRCLRVVCGKCATKRQASPEGPKVRLCYECLPFS